MKGFLSIIFILAFTFGTSSGKGLKPYSFSLKDENGKIVKLEDLKGNVIVLSFWSTTCHTCRDELPKLSKLADEYRGKNVLFFGIVIDTKDISRIKNIKKEWQFEIPILIGDSVVISKYRIIGTPITYILKKDLTIGKIIYGDYPVKKYKKIINKLLKEN
ncbi:peroxiredoxin family protein [Persephonella sp.]